MQKRGGLTVLSSHRPCLVGILVIISTLLIAADPTRARCKPMDKGEPRRVLEQKDVGELKMVDPAPVELRKGCTSTKGEKVRYDYEMLVDEKGEVECAVLLNEAEVEKTVSPCVMMAVTKSIGYSFFTAPKDAQGKPVACYYKYSIESDLH